MQARPWLRHEDYAVVVSCGVQEIREKGIGDLVVDCELTTSYCGSLEKCVNKGGT